MNRLFIKIYLYAKLLFVSVLSPNVRKDDVKDFINVKLSEKKTLSYYFNVDREDLFDYTNTREDFESNYAYLDDYEDERFGRVTEQVGLLYEEDGKTPLNAAEVYDMTYEEYSDYKKKIIPIAKDRKITEDEIKEFLKR